MQQIKNSSCFCVFISLLFLVGCNDSSTTSEKNKTDTTSVVTNTDTPFVSAASSMPVYDPAMEPLTVGAKFSKKLGDTLNMKMYEFTLKPGDSAELHSHPDHAVYVLQGGRLAVTFKGTGRQIMDLKSGTGFISGALSDAGKNIGSTTVKLLVTDIYRPLGSGASSMPGYDPSLDPFTIGGTSCKLFQDTLNIKMFECVIKPGASIALHAHPDHATYFLQGGKFELTTKGAKTEQGVLPTGTGWLSGPITDSAKNIGTNPIKFVEIDVYRPRVN